MICFPSGDQTGGDPELEPPSPTILLGSAFGSSPRTQRASSRSNASDFPSGETRGLIEQPSRMSVLAPVVGSRAISQRMIAHRCRAGRARSAVM